MKRWVYTAIQPTDLRRAIRLLKGAVEGVGANDGAGTVTHDTEKHQVVITWKDKTKPLVFSEDEIKKNSADIVTKVINLVKQKEK